jgi:phosphoribosyl 1,2-cyclic phosphodiesterase
VIGLGRDLLRRARQSGKPVEAALFFSHLHHDHTQGYPFFAPAFAPATRLHLLAPTIYDQPLEQVLQTVMTPPAFPVRLKDQAAVKSFYNIYESNRVLLKDGCVTVVEGTHTLSQEEGNAVHVRMLRSYAHPGGVANYRIDWRGISVVYATDTEGYVETDRRLAAFARQADVLIHDAQDLDEHYCGQMPGLPATQGWGHSTARMAVGVAQAAGVRQLVLFHHDPSYDDETIAASQARTCQDFPNTRAAYEGLEICLEASSTAGSAAREPSSREQANAASQLSTTGR